MRYELFQANHHLLTARLTVGWTNIWTLSWNRSLLSKIRPYTHLDIQIKKKMQIGKTGILAYRQDKYLGIKNQRCSKRKAIRNSIY